MFNNTCSSLETEIREKIDKTDSEYAIVSVNSYLRDRELHAAAIKRFVFD